MRPRTMLRAAVLSALLLAPGAVSARAAQFCVGATGTACDGGTYAFSAVGLEAAVSDAVAATGADDVRIAAGTITGVTTLTLTSRTGLAGAPGGATTLIAQPGSTPLVDMPGVATITDLALSGNGTGIGLRAGGGLFTGHAIDRVRLSGFADGVTAASASLNVRESVIALGTVANARGIVLAGGISSATLERLTIGGRGTAQTGLTVSTTAAAQSEFATLRDSVVYLTGGGATKALICSATGGDANLTLQRVGFYPAAAYTGVAPDCDGGADPTSPIDLFSSSLGFMNETAGDYRLAFYSGLIDRGSTSAPPQTADLSGGARFVDGNGTGGAALDLGAYEYQRRPPATPSLTLATTTVTPGTGLAFDADAADPDPGDFTQISWDFGDGTTTSAGAPVHAYAALGTYTATATATDPTGLTSTAQVQITVANPASTGDLLLAPTPAPADPFLTATGPRVRVLSAPTRPVRRRSAGFATVGAAAADVATLETAGAVTLRVSLTRLAPGRRTGARCKAAAKTGKRCTARVPITAIGQIPVSPGTVHLRFGGKLGGRRLAKGAYEVRVLPIGIDKRKGTPATYPLTLR